jgi:hypothetical protein
MAFILGNHHNRSRGVHDCFAGSGDVRTRYFRAGCVPNLRGRCRVGRGMPALGSEERKVSRPTPAPTP